MSVYVGNLPYDVGKQDLDRAFGVYGRVISINLPMYRRLNRPRGFALMTMESSAQEERAIEALDGAEFMGRTLKVAHARRSEKVSSPKVGRKPGHRCIPFYRRPLFQHENNRFFTGS